MASSTRNGSVDNGGLRTRVIGCRLELYKMVVPIT
jgi:hypothetical protein